MSKLTTVYKPSGKGIEVNEHTLGYIEVNQNSPNYPHRLEGWTRENPVVKAQKAAEAKANAEAKTKEAAEKKAKAAQDKKDAAATKKAKTAAEKKAKAA